MVLVDRDEAKPRVLLVGGQECEDLIEMALLRPLYLLYTYTYLLVGGQKCEEVIVPCVAREGAGRAAVRHLARVRVRFKLRLRVANPNPNPSQLRAPPG